MATITVAGTVTGREGQPAVTLKNFDNGDAIASFSVADRAYVYVKPGEDRKGQYYNCQVRGKAAEIAADRIQRGDKIAVSGQLVQRDYDGKLFLDIKNCSITFLEARQEGSASGKSEMPF